MSPFLFFCDFKGELAEAVRKGRRENSHASPSSPTAEQAAKIPDPWPKSTFLASKLDWSEQRRRRRICAYYRELLKSRRREIVPLLRIASRRMPAAIECRRQWCPCECAGWPSARAWRWTPISVEHASTFPRSTAGDLGFTAMPALLGPWTSWDAGDSMRPLMTSASRRPIVCSSTPASVSTMPRTIAPYLARLGVSHVYLSPYLQGAPRQRARL